VDLSLVIPVMNEEENLQELYLEIEESLKNSELQFEIIFVDDGSSDDSSSIIMEIVNRDHRVQLVQLRRNFGQTAAMAAGFERSTGKVIVPLDADRQNDPKDILPLVYELNKGFDCVSGWRKDRQDKAATRLLPSWIANRMIMWATGIRIHDSGCTLKAYDGDLLRSIPLYGEMHRLIPFYIHLAGGRIAELEVNHRARTKGISKYGLSRTFRVIQDVLVAKVQADFARRPMHLFGNIGLTAVIIGIFCGISSIILKILSIRDFIQTPLPLIASLFVLMGLQFALSGLIAEIILRRVNLGEKDRPYSVISNK
jgi:glycosyltransferase involved in cell wall biosynthesis